MLVLVASTLQDWFRKRKSPATLKLGTQHDVSSGTHASSIQGRIESVACLAILVYRAVQLLGILLLLGISVAQSVLDDSTSTPREALTASQTLQAVHIAIYVCPRSCCG